MALKYSHKLDFMVEVNHVQDDTEKHLAKAVIFKLLAFEKSVRFN